MRRVVTTAVLIVAGIGATAGHVNAQSPSLEDLLDRATAYVNEFFERFSNVVAEEQYVQEAGSPKRKRVLRSDFLLVTFPGLQGRVSFRDVFEVDGRSVRDGSEEDRLMKLFAGPPRDVLWRARDIAEASARFNVVDIGTLSDPLITVGFLQAEFRPRFRFVRGGIEKKLGPDVRTVRFQEWRRPTVLAIGRNNKDLPAHGLIWMEEKTGRVIRTELRLESTEMVTTYRWDDDLQMTVPAEMRDTYFARDFRGIATYSGYRRFKVRTEERFR